MKKQLFIIATLVLSLGLSSCKKNSNDTQPTPTTPASTANQLYIKFTLDGVPTNLTGTTNQLNTGFGGGAYTASGFFDFTKNITLSLNIPKDTILGADMTALIGQKIAFVGCGGCPTNWYLTYDIGGNEYRADDLNNTFPANYVKILSVTFAKNEVVFGTSVNDYFVTGEFNAKLAYGSTIKNATGGTFRLIYQEAKN